MKALSVKQPWAELLVSGRKTIEIRTWRTNHRGPVLIHASAKMDDVGFDLKDMPLGCLVGVMYLTDCVVYKNYVSFKSDYSKHLNDPSWYDDRQKGFHLLLLKRFVSPVPCKGSLGFWEYPDSFEDIMRCMV